MAGNDIIIASSIVFVLFIAAFVSSMVSDTFDDTEDTNYNLVSGNYLGNQSQNIEDVSLSGFTDFFTKAFIWDTNINIYFNIVFWILRGALVFIIFRALWPGGGA